MKSNSKLLFAAAFFGNLFFEQAIWILYLSSINMPLYQIGILQSLLNVTMFIAEVPSGVLADRIGRKKTLLLGHFFIAFYLITLLATTNFWIIAIGFIVYGLGLTFISGADEALLYDSMKAENRESRFSKAIGSYNAIIVIALALAMAIGGWLQTFTWSYVFIFGIVAQFISMFLILFIKEVRVEEEKEELKDKRSLKYFVHELQEFIKINTGFKYLVFGMALFFGITSVYYMYSQQTLLFERKKAISKQPLLMAFLVYDEKSEGSLHYTSNHTVMVRKRHTYPVYRQAMGNGCDFHSQPNHEPIPREAHTLTPLSLIDCLD